jgi:cell division GTPase FtsZ
MSMAKAALQNIVDNNAQILRGRDSSREFRKRVQILVIEAFEESPAAQKRPNPSDCKSSRCSHRPGR